MSAHTPTPWRTDSAECSTDTMTYIYGADGSDFAHVPTEDGDHIVRCVNAHDDMRTALMKAREDQEEFGHLTQWAVDLIEAALAKAIAS